MEMKNWFQKTSFRKSLAIKKQYWYTLLLDGVMFVLFYYLFRFTITKVLPNFYKLKDLRTMLGTSLEGIDVEAGTALLDNFKGYLFVLVLFGLIALLYVVFSRGLIWSILNDRRYSAKLFGKNLIAYVLFVFAYILVSNIAYSLLLPKAYAAFFLLFSFLMLHIASTILMFQATAKIDASRFGWIKDAFKELSEGFWFSLRYIPSFVLPWCVMVVGLFIVVLLPFNVLYISGSSLLVPIMLIFWLILSLWIRLYYKEIILKKRKH